MKSLAASDTRPPPSNLRPARSSTHHGAACFQRLVFSFRSSVPSLHSCSLFFGDLGVTPFRTDRPGHFNGGNPLHNASLNRNSRLATAWGCGERLLHERARGVDGGIWSVSPKLLRGSRSAPNVCETGPRCGVPFPCDPHFHDSVTRVVDDSQFQDTPHTAHQAKVFFLSRVPTWCLHPTPTAFRGGDQSTTFSTSFEAEASRLSGSTSPPRTVGVGSVPLSLQGGQVSE